MIRSKLLLLGAAIGLFAGSATPASASLVWNLDTVYESTTAIPSGVAPWATITLAEMGSYLELKIESNLQASGEFFDKIGLSYSGEIPPVPLITWDTVSDFKVDSASYDSVNFPQGEKLNIVLDFANSAKNRFDGNDVAIFRIDPPEGLEIPDWTTLLTGNQWLVAAHVNGLGLDNEASAAITGPDLEEIPIPEPSTYIAGALLLLPFAACSFRRFRKRYAS